MLSSPLSGSRALARQERMSRTTVRRWPGRFVTERCDGLQDRPRSGRPKALTPATRALVVALACERPADREVPLRRYSLSELTIEIANRPPIASRGRGSHWLLAITSALTAMRPVPVKSGMRKMYRVKLFGEERGYLEELLRVGKAAARTLMHARILLKADEGPGGPAWSDDQILEALR
jgi:hypothetical protein